jgi:glycosyltransferase involved in cell wall biosynthesis
MLPESAPADVCLILEGAYPYVQGGVSTWMHETILMQDHLAFSIVALVSADASAELLYELPENVVSLKTIRLQCLPEGCAFLTPKEERELFPSLEDALLRLQGRADLNDLHKIIRALAPHRHKLGSRILLNSSGAWDLLLHMYQKTMPRASFLDYFWSWRSLFGGLYSILLAELPAAKAYHAFCTGYAGLLLARARIETKRSCALTEHGIYSNERRIEIAGADWLDDPHDFNLSVPAVRHERDLKDFWMDTFGNYAKLCYEACSQIVTLYSGNQEFQRMDGAAQEKLRVISNGIDSSGYDDIATLPHPPTVALIGRVVPIKDIKTFIRAVQKLEKFLPEVRAFVLGPEDEDPDYARECHELVEHFGLEETIIFTGSVQLKDYFGIIDVVVLTSLSEAQPLVVLEAGAAGIPIVATDVGACREMILGVAAEHPKLGPGGAIVSLASAQEATAALLDLLTRRDYYERCSKAIAQRVRKYYSKEDQRQAYRGLYRDLIGDEEKEVLWRA